MNWKSQPFDQCPHGLKVFKVDGTHVRNHLDSDFDQGGNGYRYPFIPKTEIWVDQHEPETEVPFIVHHECSEVEEMKTGKSYDDAHDDAKRAEDKERKVTPPNEDKGNRVALVTAYNGQGQLLVGKRNDNQKYTLPGGHLNPGEAPEKAAVRELFEETGLRAQSLSHLKNDILPNGTELYCFSAYVTGSPHGKNDPDQEVSEWEWIDVEDGLPPKVYDNLHGPPDEQNLVKQLFSLQKSEWELVKKEGKVWHSDDWGTKRISIPGINHPDRLAYDQNYVSSIRDHYGPDVRPVKVSTDQLTSKNEVHNKPRYDLYRKMFRKEGKLPPLVVRRNLTGTYDILDGNHKYHAARAEGGGQLDAMELPPEVHPSIGAVSHGMSLKKAEDEVYRMLDNPDPVERAMALKLDTVRPEHLFAAALDPDPSVYQAAIDNPKFGPAQALSLMEAVVGKNGAYPDAQKRLFLMRHGRVEPYHFSALLRAARVAGPQRYTATVADVAAHPMAPEGILRSTYLDPDVTHDSRMAIVRHLRAPMDVLDHALRTGVTFASGGAGDVAGAAVAHVSMPYGTLRSLVARAADQCEPHVVQLAERALEYNQGLPTPALAEIFRDLLPKAQLKPGTAAPALLAALLRNPNTSPALADEATRILPPDTLLRAGVMSNPSFGPRHLQKMLDMVQEDPLGPPQHAHEMDNVVRHPIVMHQLGFDPSGHSSFRAAKFLACGVEVSPEQERAALYEEDGDVDRAALLVYGMPCTDENLAALHAIAGLSKSDPLVVEPTPRADKVVTAHPEGEDVADMVRRAFKTNFVFPVALGGKHSKGSVIAYDEKTRTTILLKSGSGGAGGAAGSKQDPSDPNAREAAFYYVAKEWGIDEWFPRAEQVIIDDHSYAALQLLDLDFTTLDHREKKDPGTARRILHPYLYEGLLHKWAVADFVLGNPDRHGQNVMVNPKGTVRLIDHGSAFAGTAFDPAHDNGSFVPYYLRAWALDENFNKLPAETKLKCLPRVPESVAQKLRVWVASIVPENLKLICHRYGIDPQPTMDRLQKVQIRVANEPVDVVIDQLWVTT